MAKEFDPENPPELCAYCPDLEDEFFQVFNPEWLGRLACSFCGLPLMYNKTMLNLIKKVIKDIKNDRHDNMASSI